MDNNDIKGYIEKLKQLERDLSSGETEDLSFMDDLNELLGKLNTEFRERAYNSSNDLIIPIKRLHPNAVIPTYSKDGDAGMDLTIVDIKFADTESVTYGFGISIEIPKGYIGLVLSDIITIINNNEDILIKSNKKYNIGDVFGKLIVIPTTKFKIIE